MPIENNSSRRLAAILFADIAGYTAMMQSDEGKAMNKLRHYQTVLKRVVAQCKGEIIKNYGDGSLCLFTSVLDAVHCAKALQETFRVEPVIPLRIGLHLGDVMYEENDIYGNSINVASRIESMGIPGAVLMSKNVLEKVKNQADLKFETLGSFDFKNVEEPMEVYALANEGLAVPKREEMQGKGKATSGGSSKLLYVVIPILLLAGVFGIYKWQQSTPEANLIDQFRNERIAVLPFKNNTNDANLEILGDMSADWINRGLMEIEGVEVTSPFTVRSNLGALGIAPDDPQGRRSFSELTGAQNTLSGNYYEENGNIIFQLQIESATDGKIRFSFDPIRGPKDDKETLLAKLGSQVAGYWIARDFVDTKNIEAPNYEAYVAYNNALKKYGSGTEYAKVFELDSCFYMARLHFLNNNRYGVYGDNITHFAFLDRHVAKLSSYETAWFNYLKGLYLGDFKQAFESLNNLRKKYPKDFILNHETAVIASEAFNNSELTLEIYNELPLDEVNPTSVGIFYNNRILHLIISYIRLGQYSDLSSSLDHFKIPTDTENIMYIEALLTKALAEQNPDEINKAYTQFLKVYEYNKLNFFYLSSLYLYAKSSGPIRTRLKNDYLSLYQKVDNADMSKHVFKPLIALIDDHTKFMLPDENSKLPKTMIINALYAEAIISLENKDIHKAESCITQLIKYTEVDYELTSASGPGYAHYYLGKIFTKMGKPNDAIRHLKASRKLGFFTRMAFFKYDIELASLVGIPEFDALHDPIWPEAKN